MAFSRVQGTGNSSGSAASLAKAFAGNVTAGNLLVVGCGALVSNASAQPVFTVTDNQSNTYRRVARQVHQQGGNNWETLEIWYAIAAGTNTPTVTITPNLNCFNNISIDEYSYTGTLAVQGSASNHVGSGTIQTGQLQLTGTDLLYGIAAVSDGTQGSTWAGAGSTTLRYSNTFTGGVSVGFAVGERISPAGTTTNLSWTYTGSTNFQTLGVSFGVQSSSPPWTFVQGTGEDSNLAATSKTCTLPLNVSVGDLIVVAVGTTQTHSNAETTSVSDSAGNTYTQAKHAESASSTYVLTDIWYTVATTGGAGIVVTATTTTSSFMNLAISHYIHVGAVSVDGTATAGAANCSVAVTAGKTDLLIEFGVNGATNTTVDNTVAAGSGWNLRHCGGQVGSQNTSSGFADQLNITTTPISTGLANLGGMGNWQTVAVSFSLANTGNPAALLPAM